MGRISMLNRLGRWLRGEDQGPPEGLGDLERKLDALEREAREDGSGLRGASYNRAGDLCLHARQRERAAAYFGRAIDAYLEDGLPELARAVGQKLIRARPSAVRTLCTLTWLDLGCGHMADARRDLKRYVSQAEREGRKELAIEQIREMARVVPYPTFREEAAAALRTLGDDEGASRVEGLVAEGEDSSVESHRSLEEACFDAAVHSNRDPSHSDPDPDPDG